MIWLLWLILMLLIAAVPGVYLVLEQRAHTRANVELSDNASEAQTEVIR